MRTMMRITIPTEQGSKAIRDGSLPKILQSALESLKPEAAYFMADNGRRSALVFFDLKDSTQIPAITEPLFQGVNASVELVPVMNVDDLKAGLDIAAKRF